MRHFFCDSLKRFLMALSLTVVGIFSAHAANLPTGYTELEYIESTGTQWIDTGFSPDTNTRVDWKGQLINGQSGVLLGARVGDSNPGRFFPFAFGTSSGYVYRTTYGANDIYVSGNTSTVFTGSFRPSESKSIINGTTYNFTSPSFSKTANEHLLLFGVSGYGEMHYLSTSKIWYVKIWDNGTLVRDFVPAKNASGVIGMYDTVNNQFYTNAGSGAFTAGPMACNGTRMNYTTATGTVTQNGTPTPTNPITPTFYTQGDLVLRKVGDVADSYDATTGKITRRIGMKVLDGTEDWKENATSFYLDEDYNAAPTNHQQSSSHYEYNGNQSAADLQTKTQAFYLWGSGNRLRIRDTIVGSLTDFTDFLAAQYTAGTPVTVYYLLATETEEDWVAEQCIVSDGIKIATTKYTEDAFAGLITTLESAINKVTNIVDTTVQQATEIGNLATTKQDRPDTDCPAGRKCLLIMGADNKPHWYLIQE